MAEDKKLINDKKNYGPFTADGYWILHTVWYHPKKNTLSVMHSHPNAGFEPWIDAGWFYIGEYD